MPSLVTVDVRAATLRPFVDALAQTGLITIARRQYYHRRISRADSKAGMAGLKHLASIANGLARDFPEAWQTFEDEVKQEDAG